MSRNGLTYVILALLHAVAAPPLPWWSVPPQPDPRPCTNTTTTTAVFGRATPSYVGESLVPSPDRPAYRLMEPSEFDVSPWGLKVHLCPLLISVIENNPNKNLFISMSIKQKYR
jgi:hypothetical protein